jgi:aminoglycoside 3-N-acetyltransferase
MVTYRDLIKFLARLEIPSDKPVIVHASLSAFGEVRGGAETVVGALLKTYTRVLSPAFTYKTMIIPEIGPSNNGIVYGSGDGTNRMAHFFRPDLPADITIGKIPETLRQHPDAQRSHHPILSFSGVGVEHALQSQTLAEPLSPIEVLTNAGGWVLLMGVDQSVNTSLHYAEKLAGRKQFVRWALTPSGIYECPGFPGCSDGFEQIAPHIQKIIREQLAGETSIQGIPLPELITIARDLIENNPRALLCSLQDCPRCSAVREHEI